MTVDEMAALIKTIDLPAIGMQVMANMKEEAIDLNRSQLLEGLGNDGNKIPQRYKSDSYAKLKNKMNPFPGFGVPDGYKTGAMHEAWKLAIQSKNVYLLYSSDSKFKQFIGKYPTAAGLNPKSIEELRNRGFMEGAVQKIKEHLTL